MIYTENSKESMKKKIPEVISKFRKALRYTAEREKANYRQLAIMLSHLYHMFSKDTNVSGSAQGPSLEGGPML